MQSLFHESIPQAWVYWLIIGILCGILELSTPTFGFLFAALAAVLTALISPWASLLFQLLFFAVILLVGLLFMRPPLLRRFHSAHKIPSRVELLMGKVGQVTEAIDPVTGQGRILVDGQDWAATADGPVPVGQRVVIEGADGIILKTKTISSLE